MPATATRKRTTKAPAEPAPADRQRSRKQMTDHVCDYMAKHHRDITIDTLLTDPAKALRMGIEVGRRAGLIADADRVKAVELLDRLDQLKGVVGPASDVCHCALASRKRGELKRDRY